MLTDQPACEDYSAPPPNPYKGLVCPECGGDDVRFHLMMRQCDGCVKKAAEFPDKYVKRNGLLIPNPDHPSNKVA